MGLLVYYLLWKVPSGGTRHCVRHLTLSSSHTARKRKGARGKVLGRKRESGIRWQPSGQDSTFPLPRARVQPLVRELGSCNLCSAAKERKEGREEEERKRERGRERRRREGRERKYIPVWPYSTHPNPHSTQVKEEGPLDVPSQQRCYKETN